MTATFWVASHTGLPSVLPDRLGPVWAGDRLLTVVTQETLGHPVSDPLAPVGATIAYTVGDESRDLVRASHGQHMITDASGHAIAPIVWLGDDTTDTSVSVSAQETSLGVADRWPLRPQAQEWALECRTTGDATVTLASLCASPTRIIVVHDPIVCDIPGCDIEPIRVATITSASHRRAERRVVAGRTWQIRMQERDSLVDTTAPGYHGDMGYAAPVVTWGEWRAADATYKDRTYLEMCTLIAGMPA